MTSVFKDHVLFGDHASRPAGTGVPWGAVYACTDHLRWYRWTGTIWETIQYTPGLVGATFDKGGSVLDLTGTTKVRSLVRFGGSLYEAAIIGTDGPGNATFGVKACSLTDYLTDPANLVDITGGSDLEVVTDHGLYDDVLYGWTLGLNSLDVVEIELKDVDLFTQLTINLRHQ